MIWKTSEVETGKTHFIEIDATEKKIISWTEGSHWRSGVGGSTDFEKLLAGDWDKMLLEMHDLEILNNVKKTVLGLASTKE